MMRRDIWRNESNLYHTTCHATGEKVLSMYGPHSHVRVYKNEYWWSDAWSAYEHGTDFDFDRPFFDQVHELFLKVPIYATSTTFSTIENSPYINRATSVKNSHLSFDIGMSEDMLYCSAVVGCYRCVDCYDVYRCSDCYEVVSCNGCNQCRYLLRCDDCLDCEYSRDLKNCQHCFGCVNLVGKQYHFNNTPCTPEEYDRRVAKVRQSRTSKEILS